MKLIKVVLLLFLNLFIFTGNSPGAEKIDLKEAKILVTSKYIDIMNLPVIKELESNGAQVRAGINIAEVTWDYLKKFNILIVTYIPNKKVENADIIEKFLENGGAVIFFAAAKNRDQKYTELNKYLGPLGASIGDEVLYDPKSAFKNPNNFRLNYSYTKNINQESPFTKGVEGLWFNAEKKYILYTSPLKLSDAWKVLVRAEKTAKSFIPSDLVGKVKEGESVEAPSIIAARNFKKGWIVLIGISPMEIFLGRHLPAYQDVVNTEGNALQKSNYNTFYINTLEFLAEKASLSDSLGKGTLEPLPERWGKVVTVDWNDPRLFKRDSCVKPAKGVIGVHSNLSDGENSPVKYIEEAKASGLQWLVFTEKFEDMSQEKWEELRKICEENSDNDFCALPGLDYAINTGDRWVMFGDVKWPPEASFSKDGKKIIDPQFWFAIGIPPNGPYNSSKNTLRAWDNSLYNTFALSTTLNGIVSDKAADAYRYLHAIHDDPLPIAVDMVYNKTQLKEATGRTANYLTLDSPGNLTSFFKRYQYGGSFKMFISNGPLITDWRAYYSSRNTGGSWEYIPSTEKYRVKLSVHSDFPVKDIKIYDGTKLFRRFCPNKKAVTLIFDVPHDKQRNLTAEITDSNGDVAISGGIASRDMLNWRFMCADRGNSICDAIVRDENGAYLMGPSAPYQRKMTEFSIFPGYGTRHFNIIPPVYDGGLLPFPMQVAPKLTGVDICPPGKVLETRMEIPVCSRDGLLQEDKITGYFPEITTAWKSKFIPIDIKAADISYRYLNLPVRSEDPGVILLEGTIKFNETAKIKKIRIFRTFKNIAPGEEYLYTIMTPETKISGKTGTVVEKFSAPMETGSYILAYPCLWGSSGAIALDDNLAGMIYTNASILDISVNLKGFPREVKNGELIKYRLLLVKGKIGESSNTAGIEYLVKAMGLKGNPAYKVENIKTGKVLSNKFFLDIEPENYGFSGTITKAELPVRLPVFIQDMNPNWTFAYFNLDEKSWFPSAVDPKTKRGYFTLDTSKKDQRIFAGHPVISDNEDLHITVVSDGSKIEGIVNNVGENEISSTVSLNPALGESKPVEIKLQPGKSQKVLFEKKKI